MSATCVKCRAKVRVTRHAQGRLRRGLRVEDEMVDADVEVGGKMESRTYDLGWTR